MTNVTFNGFCKGFGFETYPFNVFTAENERDRQKDLFINTNLYSPLLEAFHTGSDMLLSGDRGTGKTSITYDFTRKSSEKYLLCQIDDYSLLQKNYSEVQFYNFILMNLVSKFFIGLKDLQSTGAKLTKEEKILLTYFYVNFASDATRGLAKRVASEIQVPKWKRHLQSFYNLIRLPLNVVTNAGASLLAEIASSACGSESKIKTQVSEYFPEILSSVEDNLPKTGDTLEALRRFCGLTKKCGYEQVLLILDKIDEDPRFENTAEEISNFVLPILNNNKFLLDDSFQVIISLWIVPFNLVKDQVRTQKIYSPEVTWDFPDLINAFDQRVRVYSTDSARKFSNIYEGAVTEEVKNSILDLSNKNPRDLWHLMNHIFRAQYDLDARSKEITIDAVRKGMNNFVCQFNFYEYYPRKANARATSMDVYSYITHLLKLETITFTRNQLNEKAGTGSSTANYTVGMVNLGLIQLEHSSKGEAIFRIRDPKIRYAIENKLPIARP